MSHFTVLVVTKDEPTEEVLGKELAPFHEFECTGDDNEYVQTIDITEEAIKEYKSQTTKMVVSEDGQYHDAYDRKFYREATEEELAEIGPLAGIGSNAKMSWSSRDWEDGLGYRTKIHYIPDGMKEIEVSLSEVESFKEFVEGWYGANYVEDGQKPDLEKTHKYGYCIKEGDVYKVYDRTNPNQKWDWWVVGGRYSGRFLGKDSERKSDIKIAEMKKSAQEQRRKWLDEVLSETGLDEKQYEAALIEEKVAHEAWLKLSEPRPRGTECQKWFRANNFSLAAELMKTWEHPKIEPYKTIEEWLENTPWLSAYAALIDGVWHSKGEMGWFGCSHDEVEDWDTTFMKLVEKIPNDHWLTIVDCHI